MEFKNTSYILVGIKHSGKSTQGKLLAPKFGFPFYDTDAMITEETGKTPRQLYAENGVDAFMKAESDVCMKIKLENKNSIISTGGGICDNENALSILRSLGKFIFLQIPEHVAANRVIRKISVNADGSMTGVPAYIAKENPKNTEDIRRIFHEYYERRNKKYEEIADISIDLQNAPPWKNSENIWHKISKLQKS